MSKELRVGMIGYGFMGRAHSNAYKRLNDFFPVEHRIVLQAVCARNAEKAKAFAASVELKAAMEKAGVKGAPQIWLTTKAAK